MAVKRRHGLVDGFWDNSTPMTSDADTIAAIATAPGEGAISIVRISGPESLALADRVFKGHGPLPSRQVPGTFLHGWIVDQHETADEVILLIYRAPCSYTREDVVEIQGHGGRAAAQRILRVVLDGGARLADPGEFTKRAFLNGRIDLLQAEAVIDLIRARSDRAAASAIEQLDGRLSRMFEAIYDDLLAVAADLEATLDFSEDELPVVLLATLQQRLSTIEIQLKDLLETWNEGHVLREGAMVVIGGKPNVGKSTLLNQLLGTNRAIVNSLPGTTRDIIEEQMVINGYPVRLVDTAGLRRADCEIEEEGIRRARQYVQKADILIYVIDSSQPITQEDVDCLGEKIPSRTILALNKSDLGMCEPNRSYLTNKSFIECSLISNTGTDLIRLRMGEILSSFHHGAHHSSISERHRRLVILSLKDVSEAVLLLNREEPEQALAASRLRSALETLGEATGRVYHEELLNSIFSRFCIGK